MVAVHGWLAVMTGMMATRVPIRWSSGVPRVITLRIHETTPHTDVTLRSSVAFLDSLEEFWSTL